MVPKVHETDKIGTSKYKYIYPYPWRYMSQAGSMSCMQEAIRDILVFHLMDVLNGKNVSPVGALSHH